MPVSACVLIGGRVIPWSLGVDGWDLEIPFLERIEKPVRKNGPPLMREENIIFLLSHLISISPMLKRE